MNIKEPNHKSIADPGPVDGFCHFRIPGRDKIIETAGALTISRVRTPTGDHMEIKISDKRSYDTMVVARVSLEAYAAATAGFERAPCDCSYLSSEKIGKYAEYKHVAIPLPTPKEFSWDIVRDSIRSLEVDGWFHVEMPVLQDDPEIQLARERGADRIYVEFRRYVDVQGVSADRTERGRDGLPEFPPIT